MNIAVVGGCGYVGLITGLGFAALGHKVTGIDTDTGRVNLHQSGGTHIYEHGLPELLGRLLKDDQIRFITDLEEGVRDADLIFLAVGSPTGIDGAVDLSQARKVAEGLAHFAPADVLIVVKSTLPIGAIEMMSQIIARGSSAGSGREIIVNPEFLGEGTGVRDFFNPTRIVIGGGSKRALSVMRELYEPFTEAGDDHAGVPPMAHSVPYIETTIADAQMIKYASNAYLASRVSFINEIASVCEAVGSDIATVVNAMGMDPRIGNSYLSPGIGFGGPCLEKDLDALIGFSREHQYEPGYLAAVRARNDQQVGLVLSRAREMLDGTVAGKRICVFGLAFKPGTNDVRTSLSLRIIRSLTDAGALVVGHDPVAIDEARELMPDIEYNDDVYDGANDAELILILTGWNEYRELNLDRLHESMSVPRIYDGQNLISSDLAGRSGFEYRSVGSA